VKASRSRVSAWLLLVAIVGASAVWALVPTSSKRRKADPVAETSEATPASPRAQADLSQLRRAIEVLSRSHDDLAAPDRRAAMNDLLSQGEAPTRLTMLLEAAAADPSAPDKDPLWPQLVQGLATIWQGETTITSGMDLMFTESRPRARDAIVSSFAKVALERTGELTPAQQQKLTEYFIDLHGKLPAYQKREVEMAARKIGGNDVANLLQGKSPDDLEIHRDYHQALEEGQKRVAAQ
jgi:hypothetical protein